jgi:hypothetical protein
MLSFKRKLLEALPEEDFLPLASIPTHMIVTTPESF